MTIDPVDDSGRQFDTITLSIDASETVHFNSGDLETGNEGKGLSGSTGSGQGDWRLAFSSELDIEVLSYIRTEDGFLTAMHDVAPVEGDIHQVAIFNPGSNRNQVSRLRLINPTDATAEVTIRGTDDKGMPGSGEVSLSLDAGTAREITAEQLESGGTGLAGMLGDGSGKWRLQVESEQAVVAMSLLESPTDHLTNLSTVPELAEDGVHGVPLFPAAGDDSGRQGFVRAINRSDTAGEIHIKAYDETERDYEAVTLTIGGNEVVHFNSDDLEQGSPQKGLSGGTGAGEGDWRLELTSDLEIEVLSYIRTTDGFLTAMHDVAPSTGTRHRVAVFNPGSNRNQESLLRLINPADETAEVMITGVDDKGAAGTSAVGVSLVGGSSRTVGAWDLEYGAEGLDGALGDGAGKWQLMIESDRPVVAMSLLKSPTGHLTNLSTAPVRGAEGGAIGEPVGQTAEEVFQTLITGPIVQTKCINCHVEGGASANTRLVFVDDTDPDHEAINLQVFQDFLAEVEDGASYILNKIQGALGHGGGIQVAAGTDEYANMERFLSSLGEDVGPVTITPENLFDGVKMESPRSTLRRAAIVFAGRIPTEEEYESIESGGLTSLRAAIRGLMGGPEFHEFLIRAGNDRLLTDRALKLAAADVIDIDRAYFVDFANMGYEHVRDPDGFWFWYGLAQFSFARAPLELIAHVAEEELRYTEILTADYILANPLAARAYGASTMFENPNDLLEFRPSEIVSYYMDGHAKVTEEVDGRTRVLDPGDLGLDYPHAGILNTNSFLVRYPSTATNRNRARSRWTYYHFLGLDVEKLAARTTDPVALADTGNPTMHNPACTVCHSVLDPVAGAFQNYGDDGYYRDAWGGADSLDPHYKDELGDEPGIPLEGRDRTERNAVDWSVRLPSGEMALAIWPEGGFGGIALDRVNVYEETGKHLFGWELEELAPPVEEGGNACGEKGRSGPSGGDDHMWIWGDRFGCAVWLNFEVTSEGTHMVEVLGWSHPQDDAWRVENGVDDGKVKIALNPYREGDTWYRDMRVPGFAGGLAPSADNSLQWLAGKIVADPRFAEATVKFWWPAIMGREVAEPPEDENDADFEGRLLASNAQIAEVERLARGFRRGFGYGSPYNLKDLLVEIALSNWFRADTLTDDDTLRSVALAHVGATRLLTPEELSRKTVALTGFGWERRKPQRWHRPGRPTDWTNNEAYGLLYGGIDSDGITKRGRNMTSVMAGIAQRHAAASSCPIVMRELYLLDEEDRRVLDGVDIAVTPSWEFGARFEIAAASRQERETVVATVEMTAGDATARLAFVNNETGDEPDRNLRLDRLDVRGADGSKVFSLELEEASAASGCEWNRSQDDHFAFYCNGTVEVAVAIPEGGRYRFEVLAWGDQAGDELALLDVVVETDTVRSAGARAIMAKLADLYDRLLGVAVNSSSPDVQAAFDLFVETWNKGSSGYDGDFRSLRCEYADDQYYFDGILDDVWREEPDENGDPLGWDWDRVRDLENETDMSDPYGVARSWVTVVAYLMTDYRYLHL